MADQNRIRDPLELAAASLDPKVRGLAIRKKELDRKVAELQAEYAPIESFLTAYTSLPDPPEEATKPSRAPTNFSPAKPAAKALPREVFSEHIIALLREHGPLSLDQLYPLYVTRTGDGRSREAVRVLLFKTKNTIGRVSENDNRYWLVGVPLQGAAA